LCSSVCVMHKNSVTSHNVPIASPLYRHYPLFPYYALPSSDHFLQPALSVSHTPGTFANLLLNPAIQIIDSTLLRAAYPSDPPLSHQHPQQHRSSILLNSLATGANPFLASSISLTDNTAYLKDVLQPIAV